MDNVCHNIDNRSISFTTCKSNILGSNGHETMSHIYVHLPSWVVNYRRGKFVTCNASLHHKLNYSLKLTQVGKHQSLIQMVNENLHKEMDESNVI